MATANDILRIAASQIGYSRWKDPETGTKYGRWYAAVTKSPYFGANGVPYCAMFVSWVFAQANQPVTGLPGAYCPTMLSAETSAGLKVANKKDARPGDIIYFDWDGGVVDHVGIVEKNFGSYVQTIEGNTSAGTAGSQGNGGLVARRTRSWGTVKAVMRPKYATASAPKPAQPAQAARPATLDVDGVIGKKTITRGQEIAHTTPDGEIWGQNPEWRSLMPAIRADCLTHWDSTGSPFIKAIQSDIGMRGNDIDGILGIKTITNWQIALKVTVTRKIDANTAKAIQRAFNNGELH